MRPQELTTKQEKIIAFSERLCLSKAVNTQPNDILRQTYLSLHRPRVKATQMRTYTKKLTCPLDHLLKKSNHIIGQKDINNANIDRPSWRIARYRTSEPFISNSSRLATAGAADRKPLVSGAGNVYQWFQ